MHKSIERQKDNGRNNARCSFNVLYVNLKNIYKQDSMYICSSSVREQALVVIPHSTLGITQAILAVKGCT
jgi:hypothetical protein